MAEDQKRTFKDQFILRMPDGLRDRIKAAAEKRGRSMNAEIIRVLEEEFPTPTSDELTELMSQVVELSRAADAAQDPQVKEQLQAAHAAVVGAVGLLLKYADEGDM